MVLVLLAGVGIMYSLIEFAEESSGGLAVVSSKWLTPLKREVFWPPYKDSKVFNKVVQAGEECNEKWKLYKISKIYYTTDDFDQAHKKLKIAEVTSDIQTEDEQASSKLNRLNNNCKRKIVKNTRYEDYDSDAEDRLNELSRPPPIKISKEKTDAVSKQSRDAINLPTTDDSTSYMSSHSSTSTFSSQVSFQGLSSDVSKDLPEKVSYLGTGGKSFEVLLTHLLEIKQQNKTILHLLEQKSSCTALPENLPFDFPLKNSGELEKFDIYFMDPANSRVVNNIVTHWSSLGGKEVTSKVNRLLKETLDDSLASEYNFYGRNNKKPFSDLKLKEAITRAIKIKLNTITNKEIEDVMKIWLKHAPERLKLKQRKSKLGV